MSNTNLCDCVKIESPNSPAGCFEWPCATYPLDGCLHRGTEHPKEESPHEKVPKRLSLVCIEFKANTQRETQFCLMLHADFTKQKENGKSEADYIT